MIPFKDYNPTRRFPVVTVVLIAVNVAVFLLVNGFFDSEIDPAVTFEHAVIPCEVLNGRPLTNAEVAAAGSGEEAACDTTSGNAELAFPGKPVYLAAGSSMFLHADLLHLAGNMLFLWIFGNNIEDRMGRLTYLGFYLLSGAVATAAHVLTQPSSTVPLIGASGAVAGVMGAYLVLFPRVPIRTAVLIFIRDVPASWLLGFWFLLQFFTNPSEGVAWVAHVAGFVFGALVAFVFRARLRSEPAPRAQG